MISKQCPRCGGVSLYFEDEDIQCCHFCIEQWQSGLDDV